MYTTTFEKLPIGCRFRRFAVDAIAIYTKTSDEYKLEEGYPIANAYSDLAGQSGFAKATPVIAIDDTEIEKARKVEKAVLLGEAIMDKALINEGDVYLKVTFSKPQPQEVHPSLRVWR
jgi:hypothetical protein